MEEPFWTDEERFGTADEEVVKDVEIPLLDTEDLDEATGGNRTVSSSTRFSDLKDEYVELMDEAGIRSAHLGSATTKWSVSWYAAQIVSHKATYEEITTETDVPWFVIGILHALECTFRFDRHLFNGDPLSDYTKRHPRDYPRDLGNPPFTFKESAIAALEYDRLANQSEWSLAHTLYRLERYNGMGYRTRLSMASPYLWSYTTLYKTGKFKEVRQPNGRYRSVYDPNLTSRQCGAAAMLKVLMDEGHVTFGT